MSLTLSPDELVELTGYRSKAKQIEELQRRGFHRARRGASGRVVLMGQGVAVSSARSWSMYGLPSRR